MSDEGRPNILLITTDQHNADIMGCAGNPVVRTPHLDRLAGEGVLFQQAYTPHLFCTPARTTMLTGQTADHHGVPYNINLREDQPDPEHFTGLREDAVAFPEILASAGYGTALFGKLHTKQQGPKSFGIQRLVLAEGKGQFVEHGSGLDTYRQHLRAKGIPDEAWRTWETPEYRRNGWVTSPLTGDDYIDAWTGREAAGHLRAVEPPFFAWVSFSGPHTPWDPPSPYDTLYDPDSIPMPFRREGELEEKHPQWSRRLAATIPATPPRSMDPSIEGGIPDAYSRWGDAQLCRMLAAYYGQITLIDDQVGRLLEILDRRGMAENTVVMVTSDHGEHLGNNWAVYKYGVPYDSLARVPMILRWPALGSPGLRRGEFVSLVDVAPTLLHAAGLSPMDPVDGTSLLPLCSPSGIPWRDHLRWDGNPRCLLTPDWKYLRWRDGFEELYDRDSDPHELHNAALLDERASTCSQLAARLDADGGRNA